MFRHTMKCFWLVAVLTVSVPALAQVGTTGTIRGDDTTANLPWDGRFTGDAARAISDKFASCVVKRHDRPVVKALQMERDTPEQYKALHVFLDPECWVVTASRAKRTDRMSR